jgi:hypothetical protein
MKVQKSIHSGVQKHKGVEVKLVSPIFAKSYNYMKFNVIIFFDEFGLLLAHRTTQQIQQIMKTKIIAIS